MADASDTENMGSGSEKLSSSLTIRRGLTKTESLLLSSLSEMSKTVFGLKDVVNELKCSYEYAKVLANNLAKKSWIVVLRRGTYLIVPLSAGAKPRYTEHEFVIASHLVSPYYIAYWSALNFHGFTEQTPLTVFVATTKRIRSREILNIPYRFVTLSERKLFGFTAVAIGANKVNISDGDKTIADCLDHPEYCGGMVEAAKSLWNAKEKVEFDKIVEYAGRMGNSAIVKRLGYLAEALDMKIGDETVAMMEESISSGISVLDPSAPKKGKNIVRWNLLLNVPEEALIEWRRGY